MTIEYPRLGLLGDAVQFRIGYDGSEPDAIRQEARRSTPGNLRCAVALNTYYPEIANSYYVNKNLIGLIQACLHDLGLMVVLVDVYREEGTLVPAEPPGTLVEDENYYLVTQHHERLGQLYLWQFDAGGGSAYYAEHLILDIILPERLVYLLSSQLRSRCSAHHVPYEEFPTI